MLVPIRLPCRLYRACPACGHPHFPTHAGASRVSIIHFYTYSPSTEPESERWDYTGIPDIFFDDIHAVREAVMALRKDITSDPERDWPPMRIEKLETLPRVETGFAVIAQRGCRCLPQEL